MSVPQRGYGRRLDWGTQMADTLELIKSWRRQLSPLFMCGKGVSLPHSATILDYIALKYEQVDRFKRETNELATECTRHGLGTAPFAKLVLGLSVDDETGNPVGWSDSMVDECIVLVKQLGWILEGRGSSAPPTGTEEIEPKVRNKKRAGSKTKERTLLAYRLFGEGMSNEAVQERLGPQVSAENVRSMRSRWKKKCQNVTE